MVFSEKIRAPSIAVWSVCQKMCYDADLKCANIPNSLLHVFIPDCLVTPQPISDVPGLVDTGRGPTGAFYKRAPSWTQVSSRCVLILDFSFSIRCSCEAFLVMENTL